MKLTQLQHLKEEMNQRQRVLDSFFFDFHQVRYVVLICLYPTEDVQPNGACLDLKFFRRKRIHDKLILSATNQQVFIEDESQFRTFFRLSEDEQYPLVVQDFYQQLDQSILLREKRV